MTNNFEKGMILRAAYDAELKKSGLIRRRGGIEVSAVWNKDTVALTLGCDKAAEYTVALDGARKSLSSQGGAVICAFCAADGVNIYDGGQKLALCVLAKGECFETELAGELVLCDYDMMFLPDAEKIEGFVKSAKVEAAINPEMDPAVTDLGACVTDRGFVVHDRYNKTSPNYPHTNIDMKLADIDALADRDRDICVDMVLNIKEFPKMDYKTVRNYNASYGLGFFLCAANGEDSLYFGIQRNEGGFYIFAVGGTRETATVDLPLGVPTSLTVKWGAKGDLVFYINGSAAVAMRIGRQKRPQLSPNSLTLAWKRSRYVPASDEDSLDVEISDLNIYADKTFSVTESFDIRSLFSSDTGAPVVGGIFKAPAALDMKKALVNEKYGTALPITITPDKKALLLRNGRFVSPKDISAKVEVTVKAPTFERTTGFIVPSEDVEARNTLTVLCDRDPFVGKGEKSEALFELTADFASVIYDMGETARVNRVVLKNILGDVGVINKNHFALFTSDDNESYSYVKNFSVLTKGDTIYFYNFDVNARYIKVHTSTNGLGDIGTVVGCSEEMIKAYACDAPLLSEGEFEKSAKLTVKNSESVTLYDKIVRVTLEELGICSCDLNADKGDIRFLAKGLYMPHYFDGNRFYVRIPELAPGESLDVTVLYKNEKALSVSDGHEALEVQYGMKHARRNNEAGWFNSVATMPNGDLLRIVDLPASEGKRQLVMYRSKNCGLTWSPYEVIPNTDNVLQCGGFIVDKKNNKVFYFAYDFNIDTGGKWTHGFEGRYCKYLIFLSEDSGYTWSYVGMPENAPEYAISYSNGIVLAGEDGEGPNVDYVFTTGIMVNLETMAFSTGGMYSADGGKTWRFSDTVANFTDGNNDFPEGGLSEETVWEKKDGTLIFYARCQLNTCVHFAKSYSHDHGVTWSNIGSKDFSNIYTSNTQPIIENMDGTPVFMWGGNNSLGGNTYLRYPLNMARSYDDGETFEDIIDVSLRSNVATLNRDMGSSLHTNPDLTFGEYRGVDMAYIVSTLHQLYLIDAKAYIEKTKGAFDSFESGAEAEGWYPAQVGKLSTTTTELGATDGSRALLLKGYSAISRPVHYIREGEISFDLYAENFGKGLGIELQAAFNDRESGSDADLLSSTALHFTVDGEGRLLDNGRDTGLKLQKGSNYFRVLFNGKDGKASLTLNGKTVPVEFVGNDGYVSYFTVFPKTDACFALDRFIAIKDN